MKQWCALLSLGLLSACASQDMQGYDPREYYAQNPIKNTIESRSKTVLVHFAPGMNRLSPHNIENLRDDLHGVSMAAVQSIRIGVSRVDMKNDARQTHIKKMLRNMGYEKGIYHFEPLNSVSTGDMQIDLSYDIVVAPDCPDWRTSPVTTHSNTHQGNFGCAHEVDIGLMVADPHDLVRGPGGAPIDTVTANKAVQDYHEGKTANGSATSASGGSSTTGSNSDMGSAAGNAGAQ